MVRGKFRVVQITRNHWNKTHAQVELDAQYDPTIPEDRKFAEATPSGKISMYISNPAAIEKLELGKAYYVDFVPVTEDANGNTIAPE